MDYTAQCDRPSPRGQSYAGKARCGSSPTAWARRKLGWFFAIHKRGLSLAHTVWERDDSHTVPADNISQGEGLWHWT